MRWGGSYFYSIDSGLIIVNVIQTVNILWLVLATDRGRGRRREPWLTGVCQCVWPAPPAPVGRRRSSWWCWRAAPAHTGCWPRTGTTAQSLSAASPGTTGGRSSVSTRQVKGHQTCQRSRYLQYVCWLVEWTIKQTYCQFDHLTSFKRLLKTHLFRIAY